MNSKTTPREKSTPGASERPRAPGRAMPTRIEWLYSGQRGYTLIELAIYAAIALAVVSAISFAIWSIYKWIDTSWQTSAGISEGERRMDVRYKERDAKAAIEATRAKEEHDKRVQSAEATARDAQSAAAKEYEKGKADGKNEANRVRDNVRSGALVLRDRAAKPCAPDVPRADRASSGAGRGVDGRAGAELSAAASGQVLSAESSEWLVEFADEADEVVKQLRAVQRGWRSCVDLSRSGAK